MATKKKIKETVEALMKGMPEKELHLPSLAKAVETRLKDKVRVILRPTEDAKFEDSAGCCVMLTQELKMHLPGRRESGLFHEHFIYYPKGLNRDTTRFNVVHELGHVVLHSSSRPKKADARFLT